MNSGVVRGTVRLLAVVGASVVCLLAVAGVVGAHAYLDHAEPPVDSVVPLAPDDLRLWFTEPLEPKFSNVRVLDASGNRMDNDDSQVDPDDPLSMTVSLQPLPNGAYTVAWVALSTLDGHVTRGFYSLSVGVAAMAKPRSNLSETSVYTPWEAASRWLGYLGVLLLLGTAGFRLLVLRPVLQTEGLAPVLLPAASAPAARLLWAGWWLLLIATLMVLSVQVLNTTSGDFVALVDGTMGQILLETRFGALLSARFCLIAVLGVLLPRLQRDDGNQWLWLGIGGVSGAALATNSLNSHAASTTELTLLAVLAHWTHFVAIAVWLGGVANLALLLPSVLRGAPEALRWKTLTQVIARFALLAVTALVIVFLTGVVQSVIHVGSWAALFGTLYGQALAVKIALFVALIVVGGISSLVLRPALLRTLQRFGGLQRAAGGGHRIYRTVRIELVVAVGALAAAALLTSLSPARQTYDLMSGGEPLTLKDQAGGLDLTVSMTPARPGQNTFSVHVQDSNGKPVSDAERVDLNFTFLDQPLGSTLEMLTYQGDGAYSSQSRALSVAGRWQAELLVRWGGEDARTAFRFEVSPTGAKEIGRSSLAQAGPSLRTVHWVALGVVLILLGFMLWLGKETRFRTVEGAVLGLAGVAIIGLSVFIFLRTPLVSSLDIAAVQNPFAPTPDSLAAGEQVYRIDCASCHGVTGRGDGPAGLALNPRPADFRVHMAAGHTDGELFYWLSDGVRGTSMPAFKERLAEEQRWHVINFIRTFAPADR